MEKLKEFGYEKAKERKLLIYHCGYCGYNFKHWVGTYDATGKHESVSTQVKCPKCTNFLKTFD